MDQNIIISNINDFLFCPRSIYFHNLYANYSESTFHDAPQVQGKNAHKSIDTKQYSSKASMLEGIDLYSEELGVVGKIDLYDTASKTLIERKRLIKTIYEGYLLQVYAQFYCLIEMGYEVNVICLHSLADNRRHIVNLPDAQAKKRLLEVIHQMGVFNLKDVGFTQNPNKCRRCIYKELCDYYVEPS